MDNFDMEYFLEMLNKLTNYEQFAKLLEELTIKENIITTKTDLVKKIESKQHILFKNKPILGATKWFVVELYEAGSDYYLAVLEDGHIQLYALINYDGEKISVLHENVP